MPPPGQTQLPDWDGLKLRVRTLIATHRVMIFSKSYCPYCHRVRRRRGASLLLGPTQTLPFLPGQSRPLVRPPGEAGGSGLGSPRGRGARADPAGTAPCEWWAAICGVVSFPPIGAHSIEVMRGRSWVLGGFFIFQGRRVCGKHCMTLFLLSGCSGIC